jgi:chromosomal replication initiation ATPase DnaA
MMNLNEIISLMNPKFILSNYMVHPFSSNYIAKGNSTFDNFITIGSNGKTKLRAVYFARNQTAQNVLVISGAVGNGSTHLSLAILNEIESQHPKETVFYASFETIVSWIKNNKNTDILNAEFLNSNIAVLIDSYTDKVYKSEAQTLFGILKEVRSKVIFTCTNDVEFETKHYRISIPFTIDKKAIVKMLLAKEQLAMPQDAIQYLSEANFGSVRDMESIIISLLAKKRIYNSEIDLETVMNEYKHFGHAISE